MAAIALAALALAGTAAGAAAGPSSDVRVAFVANHDLVVADLTNGTQQVVLQHAIEGPVAWSGDGALLSDGGQVVGGPALPTTRIAWSPVGETAAYIAPDGSVDLWTPGGGQLTIVQKTWGARSLAWGAQGQLAIARQLLPGRDRTPTHQEIWIWQSGALTRAVGPLGGEQLPIVDGVAPDGGVLWWSDAQDSASIAADGLPLYDGTRKIGTTLVFPDYVAVCGTQLVFVDGGDRYTTRGKSIVDDGSDISRDTALSWVSPSCSGTSVVAAAGRNWAEPTIGQGENRSIWQLEPTRVRLTRPPAGWTDEDPQLLPDGSVLFVRTHQTYGRGSATTLHASLDRNVNGTVTSIASLTTTVDALASAWEPDYFGHYGWPSVVAVAP